MTARGRTPHKTSVLGIECGIGSVAPGDIHDLFYEWWKVFKLEGKGLLVGYRGGGRKKLLKQKYPSITEMSTLDLGGKDTDIIHDFTQPLVSYSTWFDWVFNQATLEHVIDPVAILRNSVGVMKQGGLMFVHSVGPAFRYHPAPIDCYRFLIDVLVAWGEYLDLIIEDWLWTHAHCFAVYRKKHGNLGT